MPLQECSENGKPGFKWGDSGKCYPYNPNDPASRARAREKAMAQANAIAFDRARERGAKKTKATDYR